MSSSLVQGVSKFSKDMHGAKLLITRVNMDDTLNIDLIESDGSRFPYLENMSKQWFLENTVDHLEEKKIFKCFVPENIKLEYISIPQLNDGDCLFHCLAEAVGLKGQANRIRNDICDYMETNKQFLLNLEENNVPYRQLFIEVFHTNKQLLRLPKEERDRILLNQLDNYIAGMRQTGMWGGYPEIFIFMLMTGRPIRVYDLDGRLQFDDNENIYHGEEIILHSCSSSTDRKHVRTGSHFELLIPRRHDGSHRGVRHVDMGPTDLSEHSFPDQMNNRLFTSIEKYIAHFNTEIENLRGRQSLDVEKQQELEKLLNKIHKKQKEINDLLHQYSEIYGLSIPSPKLERLNETIKELNKKYIAAMGSHAMDHSATRSRAEGHSAMGFRAMSNSDEDPFRSMSNADLEKMFNRESEIFQRKLEILRHQPEKDVKDIEELQKALEKFDMMYAKLSTASNVNPENLQVMKRKLKSFKDGLKGIIQEVDIKLAKSLQGRGGNPNYKNKYFIYKEKYLLLKKKMDK
jgi:hypothetical protein